MAQARFTPATPDQRLRQLRTQLRDVERQSPGPERAEQLAPMVREAHEQRQLNLAMHAGQLCLEDDPDAELLEAAYLAPDASWEERLHALRDLGDLARYIGHEGLGARAHDRLLTTARQGLADADEVTARHRLRTLESVLADQDLRTLRAELDPQG